MFDNDFAQRGVDIGGHARGITADVEVRAVLDPVVEFATAPAQRVLDVDLLGLVAREREVEPLQRAGLERLLPLELVEKVAAEMRIAEEQPVATRCSRTRFGAFLDEAAERRHASAGPDHDHVARRIGGQAEAFVLFDE